MDVKSIEEWNETYKETRQDDYFIYNVSRERIPIIGCAHISIKINDTVRNVRTLVTKNSPLTDLLIGWKPLVNWGIFKLTVNSIGPAAICTSP